MGSNCVASTSIGCLFCCKGCSAERLRNGFTFLPPVPSYAIVLKDGEGTAERRLNDGEETDVHAGRTDVSTASRPASPGRLQYESEQIRRLKLFQQAAEHASAYFVETSRGERIPLVWVRPGALGERCQKRRLHEVPLLGPTATEPLGGEDGRSRRLVVLHCHGNATDIGMMMAMYHELARTLNCDVVGVEYSGYGASTGSPSAANTVSDVEAAYDFLVAKSGVLPERIVIYGQSVGSGPAVRLAAKRRSGGLILHSPMLSGIKVIDPQPDACCRPSCVYFCFDFFPNDRYIKSVQCPAFVMHGQNDEIVPLYHGIGLSDAAPKALRWPGYFPRGAGHNNIMETNEKAYFCEVAAFLKFVQQRVESCAADRLSAGAPSQVEMMTMNGPPPEKPLAGDGLFDDRYAQMRAGNVGLFGGKARELAV